MARLGKHGTELLRLRKVAQVGAQHDDYDGTTVETYLAFMSDGNVLRRKVFVHISEFGSGKTERVDDGWKLYRTFHKALAESGMDAIVPRLKADFHDYEIA